MASSWERNLPDIPGLIGRKELRQSDFKSIFTTPNEWLEMFDEYKSDAIRIYFIGISYRGTVYENIDHENYSLNFTSTSLGSALWDLLRDEHDYLHTINSRLPEEQQVYLDFYKVPTRHSFELRLEIYRPAPEIDSDTKSTIQSLSEHELERYLHDDMKNEEFQIWIDRVDGDGKYNVKEGLIKTRVYQKKVIAQLKHLYQGKCQICEYSTMKEFRVDTSEAHHIEYFSLSQNNDLSNIVILCANHHRLIHSKEFNFDRESKIFTSGQHTLEIKLNRHL